MKNLKLYQRILIIVAIVIVGAGIICGSSFGIYYEVVNRNTITIHMDASKTYQTFEGFGASSCWNFRLMGLYASEEAKDQAIDMLYGEDGLNLNIFRYNLGGGCAEQEDCTYGEHAKTETFFRAEKYENKDSFKDPANYDFTKDSAYMSMLVKAIQTGNIDKLVIFSNSPHYLLTKNGKTLSNNNKENNLPEENFEAFAHYVLISSTYISSVIKDLGYENIKIYISPVNEPQWKWSLESSAQEGCHYDYDHLAKFYDVFYKTMKTYNEKNSTNFKMDIYESGNYQLGLASSKNKKYIKEFSKYDYFKDIEEISMHSYGADNKALTSTKKSVRTKFAKYFKKLDKKFVMSEYCIMHGGVDEGVETGIYSSKVLLEDLNILNAVEWNWWLGVAGGGWEDGLVYWDKDTNNITTTYRYHMYGQFMKYIRLGDVRIKADINDPLDWGGLNSVAFKKPDGKIVLVILNDNEKVKTLKLSQGSYSNMQIIETYEKTYWKESQKAYTGKIEVQPNSVTTIILS